ncbi:MAG: hypothetical protein K0Q50_508 [Vampirovibrio sp.]|jgi:hypothetical protein|nr:hypothetical protein [Vampirovibrio sp.]
MQEHRPSHKPWTETIRADYSKDSSGGAKPTHSGGAMFDAQSALSDMKKLQDPAKFDKARFSFRLYKKP